MKRLTVFLFLIAAGLSFGQNSPAPKGKPASTPIANKLFDDSKIEGPITTEIYSEKAFFDSNKNMGVFTGSVKVIDPRFNLQADKLTVFLRRGEDQGLERALAEGNVGVVRDRPAQNGQPQHAVGRAEKAVYTANDGNVELSGMPKVQQGANMHIATSPETVMVINQSGQLNTRGPSRTEIHQEPKAPTDDSKKPAASPAPKNG